MEPIDIRKLIAELQDHLKSFQSTAHDYHVLTGFDGFVDRIQRAVRKKEGERKTYFKTIAEFSDHLHLLTGKSGQVELTTERIKQGGNAPILANALGALSVSCTCYGSMGYPILHPVFENLTQRCRVVSMIDPGSSQALEFQDGKIILSELSVFEDYTWDYIKRKAGVRRLYEDAGKSQVIAFLDWANLPHATGIWDGFLHDIIKPMNRKDMVFLFDLCDPSKKLVYEIDEILDVISSFSFYGKVTLGVNENELNKLWLALSGHDMRSDEDLNVFPELNQTGTFIYNAMNIDTLLVHPIGKAVSFTKQGVLEVTGRVVTQPQVLTGGGDNLNAGYCLGLMMGLEIPLCMVLGTATSGAYVQNGRSPSVPELIDYLTLWSDDLVGQAAGEIVLS